MEIKNRFIINTVLVILFLPILYILRYAFLENNELTLFLLKIMLPRYLKNTFVILIGVVFFSLILGISTAYFEVFYEYKFKNIFKYIVIFSFAIPAYVLTYTYYELFNIANLTGVIFIYSIAFFQYIYLFSKTYFKNISAEIIEHAKLLSKSDLNILFKVIIPLSRISIFSGVILVIAEVLNDFGVANYLGIQVFSTGIYEAYYSNFDIVTANKLSVIMIIFVILLYFIDAYFRKNISYSSNSKRSIKPRKIGKIYSGLISLYFFILSIIIFIYPMTILLKWVYLTIGDIDREILYYLYNSVVLTVRSSAFIVIVALLITNLDILDKRKTKLKKYISIGYIMPGVIIAVAFIQFFTKLDNFIFKDNLYISNSFLVLLLAYTARFINIPYYNIYSNMKRIGKVYHENSRLLGYSKLKTFFFVDVFYLKRSILSSFFIVSIEIIKELSLTNILSNKTTLAIAIKNYASNEDVYLTSLPSLMIIFVAIILLYLYNKGERNDLF